MATRLDNLRIDEVSGVGVEHGGGPANMLDTWLVQKSRPPATDERKLVGAVVKGGAKRNRPIPKDLTLIYSDNPGAEKIQDVRAEMLRAGFQPEAVDRLVERTSDYAMKRVEKSLDSGNAIPWEGVTLGEALFTRKRRAPAPAPAPAPARAPMYAPGETITADTLITGRDLARIMEAFATGGTIALDVEDKP